MHSLIYAGGKYFVRWVSVCSMCVYTCRAVRGQCWFRLSVIYTEFWSWNLVNETCIGRYWMLGHLNTCSMVEPVVSDVPMCACLYLCWVCFIFIVVDELLRLKKENEQLKSENMRFRNIIDNAGLCASIKLYLFCLEITQFFTVKNLTSSKVKIFLLYIVRSN